MSTQRITAILAIFLITTVFLRSISQAANPNDIEDLIKQYQQETKCNHVSVVVYNHGDVSYYGDSEGLYQIGSMTKAFTGLAIQRLITERVIDENGVISDYIPGFEAFFDSRKADITVRNLLEQKSGFTNNEKEYPSAAATETLAEWADRISGSELNSMPGAGYAYSNVNYNLLGLVIENVSGMPYSDYLEQNILLPLGLKNTYVGMPYSGRIVEGTRLGYRHAFDFHMAVKEASIPAGYFYSNTEDMGRWIEICLGNSEIPEDFKESFSKIKEQLKSEGDYYSGWELFADGVTGHSGGTPNYSSRIVFEDKNQIGVCVLSNLNVAATTDSLCNSIFDILSGKNPGPLTKDIWTTFDIVFSAVTAVGIFLFGAIFITKRQSLLLGCDTILIVLLALVLILFPIIFGAGMKEIVFTWAPRSLAGGILTVAGDIVCTTIKLLTGKRYADHNKTGKG
ncbi:serine hydrolase domain-containing protein [Butyrivibrio sp. WCD2001]|uniref:serine hydrolase domain-containing protein n=1 Tax=Butyrivibrio sp. WCD2001 TaxID=1280681 RepID=UPI000412198B|nr:serine hydrolase domain-containing protein [Butyrivibrio sp. WCD2001]